jgi:hypothetical protein
MGTAWARHGMYELALRNTPKKYQLSGCIFFAAYIRILCQLLKAEKWRN